jgi:type II secretory pathway pseudopilin PulG
VPGKPSGRQDSAGFTLIEITFAVIILAGSLMVLLGLQSAATRATFQSGKKQEAMLAARALMSALELGETELEPQDTQAPMRELLEDYVPGDGGTDPAGGRAQDSFVEGLSGRLRVENWQLPGLDPDVVQRIELHVSWSPSPLDVVKVVYFLPRGEAEPVDEYDE